jgi:hypothetical protein
VTRTVAIILALATATQAQALTLSCIEQSSSHSRTEKGETHSFSSRPYLGTTPFAVDIDLTTKPSSQSG